MSKFRNSTKRRKRLFAKRLLRWHEKNKRDFPWRRTTNPYKILLAEQMLRKTTAKQVEEIFEAFVSKFDTPEKLKRGSSAEIRKIIRPLGLEHGRTVLLKKMATALVKNHQGEVPRSREELLELPGVGEYTASGVMCLAYGEDVPMIDRNVIRIAQRIFSISCRGESRTIREIATFLRDAMLEGKSKQINLAMLDFAAKVCKAQRPSCSSCFLSDICEHKGSSTRKSRL